MVLLDKYLFDNFSGFRKIHELAWYASELPGVIKCQREKDVEFYCSLPEWEVFLWLTMLI